VILHLGPKDRICWWVPFTPGGRPDGDTWLNIPVRRLSFRLGIELGHDGPTDAFGLDHTRILDAINGGYHVPNKQLQRWWHRTLSHGGAVQLRFDWRDWRPWSAEDRAALWDFHIDWLHLKLNPKGDGCTCWSDA
jgi:hypothetical protein